MKEKIEEEKLISVLYANFSGKSRKINNWIYLAKITKKLTEFYGSYSKLAEKLSVSPELIRETLKLLDLPEKIQEIVKTGKLKHEVAWRIASIKGKGNQEKVADVVLGLNTHDAREVVRKFRNNPKLNLKEYIVNINKSKRKMEKINLMILPIDEINFLHIKKQAIRRNLSPERFISEVVIPHWIKKTRK